MSAKGRSLPQPNVPVDALEFFPTPAFATIALAERFKDILPWNGDWWECCAGDGAIIQALSSYAHRATWFATDVKLRGNICGLVDYCEEQDVLQAHREVDVVITNPPFSNALEIVQHTLPQATWGIFLLRLNWLGSISRAKFLRGHMPDVYVLPRRPSFRNGTTDATEYAWFVWGPWSRSRSIGTVEILDPDLCHD